MPDPAPAAATGPAPASAKPRRSTKSTTAANPKAPPLTDREKAAVLASADAMEQYLLWGKEAFRGTPADQLRPEGTNWRRYNGTAEDPRVDEWDVPSFAGYYWFRVSKYREKRDLQLTLPNWGRLTGDIKNALATMTKRDVHRFIGIVVQHFELIQFMCQRAGQTMALNETSLSHNLIKTTAFNLANMTQDQLVEQYRKMRRHYGLEAA
jgi:hypothetical protein